MSAEPLIRSRQGFLLLEALLGLAILGVVVIALLAATSQQVRTADRASVMLTAAALAQDRAAALQLADHARLLDPPDSLLSGAFAPPFDEFRWTAQVEPAEDEHGLFAIRVEVDGRGHRFLHQTLAHRPTPLLTAGEVP